MVEGSARCAQPIASNGMCHKHRRRALLYGDPLHRERAVTWAGHRCEAEDDDAPEQPCGLQVLAKGLCSKHYQRLKRTGTTLPAPATELDEPLCSADDDDDPARPCGTPVLAKGLCRKHYQRRNADGTIRPLKTKKNKDRQCPICGADAVTRGFCLKHGRKDQRHGDPTAPDRPPGRPRNTSACSHCADRDRPIYGHGYCQRCYKRWWKYGTPDPQVIDLPSSRHPTLPPPIVDEDWRWAAGFIDGESAGCMGISCTAEPSPRPVFSIDQTDRGPLDELVVILGGQVRQEARPTSIGNTVWRWHTASAGHLRHILPALIPMLACKADVLEELLKLANATRGRGSGRALSAAELAQREAIAERARQINQTPPDPEGRPGPYAGDPWAAGYIDAEGSFAASRWRLSTSSTDPRSLHLLRTQFGGAIYPAKVRPGHRPRWDWVLDGRAEVRECVERLLPYLRLKARQAELTLDLLDTYKGPGRRLSQADREARASIKRQIQALNGRKLKST